VGPSLASAGNPAGNQSVCADAVSVEASSESARLTRAHSEPHELRSGMAEFVSIPRLTNRESLTAAAT
jgi:hypothetical protein